MGIYRKFTDFLLQAIHSLNEPTAIGRLTPIGVDKRMPKAIGEVTLDGVQYDVVIIPQHLVEGHIKSKPTMLKFPGKYYMNALSIISDSAKMNKINPNMVYMNGILDSNFSHYIADYEKAQLCTGQYRSSEFFYLTALPNPSKISKKDLEYIEKYYKYLASIFWKSKTENQRCFQCERILNHGEGYISSGLIEFGKLQSSSLLCKYCMNKKIKNKELIKKLKKNPSCLGETLIIKARAHAGK